jgi:hypothetical protein
MVIGGLRIPKKVSLLVSLDLLALLSGLTQDTCAVRVFYLPIKGMGYKNGLYTLVLEKLGRSDGLGSSRIPLIIPQAQTA